MKKGDVVYYRWKGNNNAYSKRLVEDVDGDLITFDSSSRSTRFRTYRSWLDVNELDIKTSPQEE